ncbi:aminotransferase class I/II-fold pyridoxal phosphate-dependent enzyme [Paenibacillus polymyxa]|uniref:aminotransferase class I/II-fold pyridoxal phosphate-dependent enzyme n=1 Tax=Paenibacillus TaxID=44249 RepID=UPI0002EA329D|nr:MULTISPECIES: aminotransferase class I/II-fold pyridoxal phosphate-dependent enzyme [Paenibacillus]AUS25740.1 cystathionine beta-lyase [Paenibacillus polymyxa]KAF6619276.1 aminotransferase class V-fold PLP-dependent enzyme [Paenibacillus sp. EKM101P]KAF6624367.1 aminotransferase class V-fold PLP-dependent enzyme [Paenibacillus sp. EKM102P]KAF6635858.1 aminotransferase class V-fold PLP-dependent enzyme [Paenibacillus sp. EKM10P]KAF6648438.1 aminotransferase class V-fold PLP-dependent enzyme 
MIEDARKIGEDLDKGRKFATKLLHFGSEIDSVTGASSVPIYQASTFHHHDIFNPPQHDYSRSGNPTRQALEDYIALLEGGACGFAFASGMAAISTTFMLLSAGDHVIVSEDVYGGTYRLLTSILKRMNIETTFVDMTDLNLVKEALQENTRAVYMETPSNPTLKITNVAGITSWARDNGLLTLLDNTFMTPYYQRPIEQGVDIVLHSATKFLGGHSDVLAGLAVARTESLGRQIKQLQNGLGTVLAPQESWLLMRGMKTLEARMAHSEKSAAKLANWLNERNDIEAVYYPGLENHPGRVIHESQSSGYGAVISFDVGSGERAKEVLSRVRIPIVAVSLGAVESILSYPAMMSHAAMPQSVRLERGITDGLLRFSVGLEDIDDLIRDLDEALS